MNKIRGSIILKTMFFSFFQIFIVIIAITIFITTTYWNYEDATFDVLEQDDFIETNYYKLMVEDSVYNLLDYIENRDKFETNGIFDSAKVVDIYDYNLNDRITNEVNLSLGYTIDQLLEWRSAGFIYSTQKNTQSNFDFGQSSSSESTIEFTHLDERYANTANIPLTQYAEEHDIRYQDLCNAIEDAAKKLENEIVDYKTQISSFKVNNTNLRYAILNRDNSLFYTNLQVAAIEDGVSQITSLGSYVLLDPTNSGFTSNIFSAQNTLNRYLNSLYLDSKNCILAIGVDTSFPVSDSFYKENYQYKNMAGWFRILSKSLLISIVGCIICLFYLSASAGHRKNSEKLVPTSFERLKSETALFLLCLPELFLYYRLTAIYRAFTLPSVNFINIFKTGIIVAFMSIFFTIGYLSFLRRIKLNTLFSNSFLYGYLRFTKKVTSLWKIFIRTLLIYGIFTAGIVSSFFISNTGLRIVSLLISFVWFGVYIFSEALERQHIIDGIKKIADGDLEFQIQTDSLHKDNRTLGSSINQVRKGLHNAIEDSIRNERLKTDLITNVSHDIKTPITSIINYVTLLKRLPIDNPEALQYMNILEEKAQRLKHLTEDLVEASKISSGNITLTIQRLNFVELIHQSSGEFSESFLGRQLTLITTLPDYPVFIEADGRRLWRVLENVYSNAGKYSLPNTRIYADLTVEGSYAVFSLKNISSQQLNIDADELTRRFIRGDISRSTEGSGLGLSIAQNLTELQGGVFQIHLDGDLFRATIQMPICQDDF